MTDPKQQDAITRVTEEPTAVEQLTEAEVEWFRLAGFSRREWQRLLFARWLYRSGELTEYPEGR
jgi:hypothetical protein